MTDDKQHDATTELNEALAAGFAAGNFDGLGAFYTEDTRLMPPRGKFLDGRAAVSAFWSGLANRFSAMAFTTVDLKQIGETVRRETGTYVMGQAAGQAAEGRPGVEGKYVFVWQFVDGEWQIESSIWNRSDMGAGRQPGQRQGQGGGPGGGQGRGGPQGPGGGYRRGGQGMGQGAGQGAGQGMGQGGGYRQPGAQGGGQAGAYRQGGRRPSFQGRGGGAGGPRRGGGQGQAGGGYGNGGALYDGDAGLYSNPKG